MKKPTIASLTLDVVRLSNDVSELRHLKSEIDFLSKCNLFTSVAGLIIFIMLGFLFYCIF